MRAPAVRVRDASVALPTVTAPFPRQDLSLHSSKSMPLRRELSSRVLSESVMSGVAHPHPITSRKPATMAAHANPNVHEPIQSERDLAAEIARVMHQRPLMNRLARVESAYVGVPPDKESAQPREQSSPPVLRQPPMPSKPVGTTSSQAQSAHGATIERQPLGERTTPPRSADWLGKARRERNHARLMNAFAWLSTVAIGGTIIASTIVALQA
jgi:hypothetical protein